MEQPAPMITNGDEKQGGAKNKREGPPNLMTEDERAKRKKKKDNEKAAKYRAKKLYLDQIKNIEGELNGYEEITTAWVGDRPTGSFKKVKQLTRMAKVRNKAPSLRDNWGSKAHWFHGAIVDLDGAIGDLDVAKKNNYVALPASNFMVDVPCYAPHGIQATAKNIIGKRITGVCFTVKGGATSPGYCLVEWWNKERSWIASHRVEDMDDMVLNNKRSKPINDNDKHCMKPSGTTNYDSKDRPRSKRDIKNIESYYSLFKATMGEENKGGEKKKKGIDAGDEDETKEEIADRMANEEETEKTKKEMKKRLTDEVLCISDLTEMGDSFWIGQDARKLMWKKRGVSSLPTPPPSFSTIETSFIFDTIRGNLRGRVVAMDEAMNLSLIDHKNRYWCAPSAYIAAICAIMADVRLDSLKIAKSIGWKRVCQVNGCSNRIHGLFWKEGRCYSHGAVEGKNCIKCNLRKKRVSGNMCKRCYFEENGGSFGLCRTCNSRKPRKRGGRCSSCVSEGGR